MAENSVRAPRVEAQDKELTFRFEYPLGFPQNLVWVGCELDQVRQNEGIHAFARDRELIRIGANPAQRGNATVAIADDKGEVAAKFFPDEQAFRA